MIQDDELIQEFVIESSEHLADVESQLLQIEAAGENVDAGLVNTVFRAVHSVKGAAGFLGLTQINSLAHSLENVLNMIRNDELVPSEPVVNTLLKSADQLRGMIDNVATSNEVDVSALVTQLEAIAAGSNSGETHDSDASFDTLETAIQTAFETPQPAAEPEVEAAYEAAEEAADPVVPPSAPPSASSSSAQPAARASSSKAKSNKTDESESNKKQAKVADSSVRVNVAILDRLMNLAGELVLGRNQLLQAIGKSNNNEGLEHIAARLDQVTSELQESIMQTRMQPVGTVFGRFPRVVRDLSNKLGKQCELIIEGNEVEVDKTIVEAIGDPLTHLVRNSVDHGIETPKRRIEAGKQPVGTIRLRAFHQAGKVCIRIEDDGGGMDPERLKSKAIEKGLLTKQNAATLPDSDAYRLIFAPGFSTAAEVTDVSGRGVGMDVVKTNIEQLGGTVDVESSLGKGSAIHITLPLTLAIVPSMIVGSCGDRYAIPQTNIAELVRVSPKDYETRIGRVQGSEVLRLRGSLLPLIHLNQALELTHSKQRPEQLSEQRDGKEQPQARKSEGMNILVLESGQLRYGLVVDNLYDSEEIVVKPLGRHLKDIGYLAGATILGDGYVALILDVIGIASRINLKNVDLEEEGMDAATKARIESETHRLLLFTSHTDEQFAVPMASVARIERIRIDEIKVVGDQRLLIYRGSSLPLIALEDCISALPPNQLGEHVFVIVFGIRGREIGLIAPKLNDIRDLMMQVDATTLRENGVAGAMVVDNVTTRLLDLIELCRAKFPDWFVDSEHFTATEQEDQQVSILLVEDSEFFRNHLARTLSDIGYRVYGCVDGQEALETLEQKVDEISIVVTDIEMPRMDGLTLSKSIRASQQFRHLPIIAVTSLASDQDRVNGKEAGIDDYQIKLDQEQLVASIERFTAR